MIVEWIKHGTRETWAASTPIGLVTVALRRAAGRMQTWTALDRRGRRIATGRTAVECMANAEPQIERLAAQEPQHDR